MEEINVENLHEYLRYNVIKENRKLEVIWDGTNPRLNYLMSIEDLFITYGAYKSNLLWIEGMKEMMDWEEGVVINLWKYIHINTGKITLYVVNPDTHHFQYLKIDENGYLLKKTNSNKLDPSFRRCSCLYNELMDECQHPYLLK